jgi:hypothetical protein
MLLLLLLVPIMILSVILSPPKPLSFVSIHLQSEIFTLLTIAMVTTIVVAVNVTTGSDYVNSDPYGFVGTFYVWEPVLPQW